MWDEACTAVCRSHEDVVAVFESPLGRLALLLRQPLVPAPDERADWLSATQRSARAVTVSLRAVGRSDEIVILQWQPLRRVAHIMADWDCSYEGDEIRHAQLVASICAGLTDGGPITPPVAGLGRWYRQMTPSWMSAEPPARRRLILRTHRWIAEPLPRRENTPRAVRNRSCRRDHGLWQSRYRSKEMRSRSVESRCRKRRALLSTNSRASQVIRLCFLATRASAATARRKSMSRLIRFPKAKPNSTRS